MRIASGHSNVSTLRSFEALALAQIVVILFCFSSDEVSLFGNFYFLDHGFSCFLLHMAL